MKALLRQARISKKAAPTLEAATFIASTDAQDRYNDIVDQGSWKLDNYLANPVIQVNHSYRIEDTVGRGSPRIENGQLMIDITWGKDEKSQEVAQKVMDGLVGAVSVGFIPGRSVQRNSLSPNDPLYSPDWGCVHFDCELLEVSVVAVPANQEALVQRGVSADINIDSVVDRVLARLTAAKTQSSPAAPDFLSLSLSEVKL